MAVAQNYDRPVIDTARLHLRRPDDRDVPAIIDAVGDAEVARRLSRIPHPYTAADARFFLDHVVPGEWVWAITRDGTDRMIGAVGLTPDGETAELGYWLARASWGEGIVTEAARAVVAYGFDTLGLPYILSNYFADNAASGAVLRKLGFVETGQGTRPCLMLGRDVASVEMRLERRA
ncbi:GNAT family N-acetyltransferase [Sphingomonas sp. NBWT7]|uniref:GNAT family N-acetyltransferase n=1 Tax=Sphingomonas sp. NBWT7 TaxID=2596913 RepID=UPI0016247562|nr:GNAT family N-acetyltransferase [Sphingomonas sp. NBWT7]QNE32575.1 GNAT family N-acetyltransferase [Sphingomonas sp. NBWT7]